MTKIEKICVAVFVGYLLSVMFFGHSEYFDEIKWINFGESNGKY